MSSYHLRPPSLSKAVALGEACGVGNAAAQVLLHKGFAEQSVAADFLNPKLSGLSSPDRMADRDLTCERLARACRAGETVSVFGDYDVDGTTSCAIISDLLEMLGATVHAFVANRFQGGYGFSDAALERCLEPKPSLIVTCDCGSSDHERIAKAKKKGVDVIVVDHHLVPKETLPADAFLNPHRPDCGFPYKGMCSAGLALSVAAGLRAKMGVKLDVRQWLDLVALGTVADVAPLDGDNRRMVRAGLGLLTSERVRPGVRALREKAWLKPGAAIGATEIAFRLAPRLNAAGRLGDATVTLDLLRAKTIGEARELAAQIEHINEERKRIERQVTQEACAQVEEIYGKNPTCGVVVASEGWHRGVVGISAARLVERFGVPAVVIASDDGVGHGSGRTIDDHDLYAAMAACRESFDRFGGHAAAAGLSIKDSNIETFRAGFSDSTKDAEQVDRLPTVDVELGAEFSVPSVPDLMALEPLGEANARPIFACPDAEVVEARVVGDIHLKLSLDVGGTRISAFGRELGHLHDQAGPSLTAIGTLSPDHYRGQGAVEMSLVGSPL